MNEMLGTKDWDRKVIKVVHKLSIARGGKIYWVGELKVMFRTNLQLGSGMRASGIGQWQQEDTIQLSSCVSTGKKRTINK